MTRMGRTGRIKKNIPQLKDCECGNCDKKIWSFDKWGKYRLYFKGHFGEKTRKRLSESHKGLMVGEKNPMFGKKLSEETRKKISAKVKGEKNPNFGKRMTEEQKMKISQINKGKKRTEEFKKRMSEFMKGRMPDELNPAWKGEKVGYGALHDYIKSKWSKPDLCEICMIKPPRELSNKTGIYNRNFENWQWLCSKCHKVYDNIMERNFRKQWERNKIKNQTLQQFGF